MNNKQPANFVVFHNHNDVYGYTSKELFSFLNGFYRDAKIAQAKIEEFKEWMRGQTIANEHGDNIYYAQDVSRWLRGLPVID